MSRFEEIEAFVLTVDAGSFTRAAEKLRIAKSAVSRRVQDLEQRLGVQLLVRSTRSLSLTESGRMLYDRSKSLLEDWREAEETVSEQNASLSGSIRLAAPLSFGVSYLGDAILAFTDLHPDVRVDVDFGDRRIDIVEDGFDLAIRIGQLQDSSLIARRLSTIRMIAVASPDFIKMHGCPQSPNDLRTLPALRYSNRQETSWVFNSPENEPHTVRMEAAFIANNGTFLNEAAIRGKGVAIQPSFFSTHALREGRLVQLLPEWRLPEVGLFALYPTSRLLSKRVRALIDHLDGYWGTPPVWDRI